MKKAIEERIAIYNEALKNCREKVSGMTDQQKLDWLLCRKHTGKMHDIISMSSSSKENTFCIARIEEAKQVLAETGKEIVCLHCFSESMQNQYDTMHAKYVVATEILTEKVYPVKDFPIINAAIARIESFGDVNPENQGGINQGLNYIHYCKANPETMFACWTKNPMVWKSVFDIESKPKNLIMIYSDPMINGSMTDPEKLFEAIKIVFPFIDKIFIVFNKDYIKENKVSINCGAKSCNTCRNCYRKNKVHILFEELK